MTRDISLGGGGFDAEVEAPDHAVRLDPGSASAYFRRAPAHRFSDPDRAIQDYGRALALARDELMRRDAAIALRALASASGIAPDDWPDRAILDWSEAIRRDPGDPVALVVRGFARERAGDRDGAFADYAEAVRRDLGNALARDHHGRLCAARGQYERAIEDYSEAVRLDPGFARAFRHRGRAHYNRRDYGRAIADCTEAISLCPNSAGAFLTRGNAHED